ncbi:MAG: hypothetical protein ACRD5J_12510 [Nitrososphaeraceae archaeon]
MPNNNSDGDVKLMNELRINDEKLTKEMYDAVLNPIEMLNVLTKKLQLYNETGATLVDPRNKITVGFMKVAVENRMMNTQIKKDMDLQIGELIKRIEKLEKGNS